MKEKPRIRINIDEEGQVSWERGSDGLSIREFVSEHPCSALAYLNRHPTTDLGRAVLSQIGGVKKIVEFNKENNCGDRDIEGWSVMYED